MHYKNFLSSLAAYCHGFSKKMENLGYPQMKLYNFDGHSDDSDLPDQDLIGVYQTAMATDQGTFTFTSMVGVSTLSDTNLFRLTEMINFISTDLMPGKTIPLLNADSGAQMGLLTIMNGAAVMPVVKNKGIRPVQIVAAEFGTGRLTP